MLAMPGTCQGRRSKDVGSIPGLGRSPGGRHGSPLQYSCLENPIDRGAWRATVVRVGHYWRDLACDLNGKRVWKRIDTYVCITESFCCTPETNTTLLINCACVLIRAQLLSSVWLLVTPWTVAYHVPLSMGFSRREYWSGSPFPTPGNLPDPAVCQYKTKIKINTYIIF